MTTCVQVLVCLAILITFAFGQDGDWKAKKNILLKTIPQGPPTQGSINYFGVMKENLPHFESVLKNILIPRVPGTKGNEIVRNFIVGEMQGLGWSVELDSFVEPKTIVGQVPFHNIIATLDPEAPRRLVLACHYDSKASPAGFLGATDSAVPCAQMINLAHTMQMDLNDAKGRDLTLQMIFFDGEEAFKEWTSTDSIYGARHLAQKWSGLTYTHNRISGNYLDRIDVFVLLDLLGAKNPTIYSMNPSTERWYSRLSTIENELINSGLVPAGKIFAGVRNIPVEDDHIPFLRRGVNILHLIATPFPDVWHTLGDDASVVDLPTVEKFNKIFRIFVAEYLGLG